MAEFGVPPDATYEPPNDSSSDGKRKEKSACLLFPPDGKIVIGKESAVHQGRNFLLLGRQAATCDIRISQKSLSRQHAVLYYQSSGGCHLYIKDLDTKTGTFVNGTRITPQNPLQLNDKDTIQFGKAQPVFTLDWEGDNTPPQEPEQDVPKDTAQKTQDQQPTEESNNNPPENPPATKADEAPQLDDRARRKAEIDAMMASLDEAPTYTKYVPDPKELEMPKQRTEIPKNPAITKHKLPVTNQTPTALLDSSTVSSMAMDPSGARFALGCMDSSLRLYDFAGYNVDDPTPFANSYVQEGYPIRSLVYSPTGDRCVVATGSAQPRLMDREGQEELQFVRGDVYVTDPQKTSGHTAAVTCVQWHPLDKSIVFTTSRDGSLRTWNVDKGKLSFNMLTCKETIVVKNVRTGRRTVPTCMSASAKFVALGTECGSLQLYQHNPSFVSKLRPQQSTVVAEGTMEKGKKSDPIVSVLFSVDATSLACRTPTSVLVYDTCVRLSTSSTPVLRCTSVGTVDDMDNSTPTMAFSPSGKVLCVGVHHDPSSSEPATGLRVYVVPSKGKPSKMSSAPIFETKLDVSHPLVGLSWHTKLNQIMVTSTKGFSLWYSTEHSKKGILLSASRSRKKRQLEEDLQEMYQSRAPPPGSAVRYEEIVAPNALPMFGGDSKQKRRKEKAEEEDNRQHPQQPAKSIYNTPNTIFAQLVVDNHSVDQKIIAGKDPRAALAKYSEGKSYIGTAYEGNKERILADKTVEEEEQEMEK